MPTLWAVGILLDVFQISAFIGNLRIFQQRVLAAALYPEILVESIVLFYD